MYYSYVMGVDDSIENLKKDGFIIEKAGKNYKVMFPEDLADVWEDFISRHLAEEYWNEYLYGGVAVFLFRLKDGIKRYDVKNYENDEVLALCEEFCGCKFESVKAMLRSNRFYKDKIE